MEDSEKMETNGEQPAEEAPQPKKKRGHGLVVLAFIVLLPLMAYLGFLGGNAYRIELQNRTAAAETPEPEPTPEEEPAPEESAPQTGYDGYFAAALDGSGLFRPEDPFTSADLEIILRTVTGGVPNLKAESAYTEDSLEAVLESMYPGLAADAVNKIRGIGSETVTRAEAAVCLNCLFPVSGLDADAYYPDIEPGYWAETDVLYACGSTGDEHLAEGFFRRDGVLYHVDENGYLKKNGYVGSLYFDGNGRYTCGNEQLDGYVRDILAKLGDDLTQERILHEAYLYVRDSFTYLKRHYYSVGETGWWEQEALTMFKSKKGNCYCFASTYWLLCRGMGFDAKLVSGTFGTEGSPHSWVEIVHDGERLTYDTEIEMAYRQKGHNYDFFALTDKFRPRWCYFESEAADNAVPRAWNSGLQAR